ncbi:hypothetical protein E8A74_14560 [Polyangium fumosum]|uniref:Uncharacterized protein n=1 Tax=Polyangium fumosum TaxID=889272 RepID=A0A4U1JCV9_9BACT|nr:hypothetical protein E8A74_14560 [Polyangium fumosum]
MGKVLTTNMSSGDHNFTSNVVLQAVTPSSIQPSQLTMTTQILLNDPVMSGVTQRVTAYFWTMPVGLEIYSITHVGEPKLFFVRKDQGQLLRGRGYPSDINMLVYTSYGDFNIFGWQYRITIAKNQFAVDVLRVNPFSAVKSTWNTGVVFSVIDMYGNEHRYRVDPSSDDSTVTIAPGPRSIELPQAEPAHAELAHEGEA